MIKVSIVVPVYNVEQYLEKCLDSAVNQNFDSFEVIAVNDGSTDGSGKILQYYEEKYEFFKLINQENKGLSGARNTGLEHSSGKYVYFLDSDDYIHLDTIKECYNECINNDLDIICFDAESFWDNPKCSAKLPKTYDRKDKIENRVYNGVDFVKKLMCTGSYKAPIWLNFYKKEFLIRNNLRFAEGYLHEDEIFTIDAYILSKRIKHIDRIFFFRRLRENSITTSKVTIKHLEGRLKAAENYDRIIFDKKYKDDKELIDELINYSRVLYYWILVDCYIIEKENGIKLGIVKSVKKNINKNKKLINSKLFIQMILPKLCYYLRSYKNRKE